MVDLLCSSLSAHERHQGVQAVALRTLVLLTEDGKAVCVCTRARVCVPVVPEAEEIQRRIQAASTEERRRRLKCTSCVVEWDIG